uniref:Uncharacterized protein n=1 Tax=Anopheles quadriannulatus TaxID=34691 RepID=A0A182XRR0_ANOQN
AIPIVLPLLLYGTSCWTVHQRKLDLLFTIVHLAEGGMQEDLIAAVDVTKSDMKGIR